MSPDQKPPALCPNRPRRLLRCDVCGRAGDCAATDLLRYTREGWPKCCGHVMTFFTETARPETHDTVTDPPPAGNG